MELEIISLEADDEIPSAKAKIAHARAPYILLVYPQFGDVFRYKMEILLLRRFSLSCGKQLALVSTDSEIQVTARSIGISVFQTIEDAQKRRWRRSFNLWVKVKEFFKYRPKIIPLVKKVGYKVLKFEKVNFTHCLVFRILVFLLGIMALLSLVLFFLPTASVKLEMAGQRQEVMLDLLANPRIQAPNLSGGIPIYILTIIVEGQEEIDSSEMVHYPENYAEGVVQFTNLTNILVEVPAGTLVTTSSLHPVRYLTTYPIKVPAGVGETVNISIKAVLPGPSGNVLSGQITAVADSLGLLLAVTNPHPLAGGEDHTSPIPGNLDYQKLHKKILNNLSNKALADLQVQAGEAQFIVPETLQLKTILEEKKMPDQLIPGDILQLKIRAEYSVWAILKSDINILASKSLDANLPQDTIPDDNSISVTYLTIPHLAGEDVRWQIKAQRTYFQLWSRENLWELTGKSKPEAVILLNNRFKLKSTPIIRVVPDWMNVLPFLPIQIKVEVK